MGRIQESGFCYRMWKCHVPRKALDSTAIEDDQYVRNFQCNILRDISWSSWFICSGLSLSFFKHISLSRDWLSHFSQMLSLILLPDRLSSQILCGMRCSILTFDHVFHSQMYQSRSQEETDFLSDVLTEWKWFNKRIIYRWVDIVLRNSISNIRKPFQWRRNNVVGI